MLQIKHDKCSTFETTETFDRRNIWYPWNYMILRAMCHFDIDVDIGRDARNRRIVVQRVDAGRERYRDAVTIGAREKERTTGGHIWSRGPWGSQVTPASDGASRFHDDVRRVSLSLSSLYLRAPPFLSSRSLSDAVLLARSSPCRAPKIPTVVPWVRETRRTEGEEQERSVISRLSGIAGFLESCRSSPFPISRVFFNFRSRRRRSFFLAISKLRRSDSSDFARDVEAKYVDCRS